MKTKEKRLQQIQGPKQTFQKYKQSLDSLCIGHEKIKDPSASNYNEEKQTQIDQVVSTHPNGSYQEKSPLK